MSAVKASYDQLADEYYDPDLHPTCANFRSASKTIIASWLTAIESLTLCETGAGRSMVTELGGEGLARPSSTVLIDESIRMLRHSSSGGLQIAADAGAIPLGGRTVDAVVASLGDAYNRPNFWREVARICAPGAVVIYTTPSYEWATAFRDPEHAEHAEFVTRSGEHLWVPSFIPAASDQVAIAASVGLRLDVKRDVYANDLVGRLSPKLIASAQRNDPIVTGFRFERFD